MVDVYACIYVRNSQNRIQFMYLTGTNNVSELLV